jgi:hypothetical protein
MALEDRLFRPGRLRFYGAALVAANAIGLVGIALTGQWLFDLQGGRRLLDFAWIWTGGRLALSGRALQAYDPAVFLAALKSVPFVTEGGSVWFRWVNPPSFFLYVIPFAALPYALGFFAWLGATAALYLAAIRQILPVRGALLWALVPVPVLDNVLLGHSAFLQAGLIGLSLALVERRPRLAGVALGLLTYKPQLGLLFPAALAIGGRWRVIVGAAATTIALAAASLVVFDPACWAATLAAFRNVDPRTLMPNDQVIAVHQSAFGLATALGWQTSTAWIFHWSIAGIAALIVCWIWRRPAALDLKAAALASGTLLSTPYLLLYDLTSLVIPAAFLVRHGMASGFLPGDRFALLFCLLLLEIGFGLPIGILVMIVLLALTVRQVAAGARPAR